jgi:predicted metal-dependent hydrolase
VTVPRGGSLEFAVDFAKRNRAWIEKQLTKSPRAWEHGTTILFRGISTVIQVAVEERFQHISLGSLEFRIPLESDLRTHIEAKLRAMAAEEFPARTRELALTHAVEIQSVQVRNQRSRWGSCSRSGRISLNWRLIQTPEFVRDYIIIHELMHRREMNHSDRFWAHVQSAFPDYMEAERWLRKHAALLR